MGATSEQEEQENGQANPDEQALPSDGSEDDNYLPLSEDEVSLGDEDFIIPEEPLEQERFKCRLIATARSLKKKQQQLQADQDLVNDRWTEVLVAEEYGLSGLAKSHPNHILLYQSDDGALGPIPSSHNAAGRRQLCPDKKATQAEHQTAPPRRKGKNNAGHDYPDD